MGADRGEALAVTGLSQLQRALKHTASEAKPALRKELKGIGEEVKLVAGENVSHRTGRHGSGPRLAGSIKVSVRQAGVSVYSNAPHAFVQDRGGRVGRGHRTILERGKVSQYMTRAVRSEQDRMSKRLEGVLDRLGQDFQQ